MDTRSSQPEEIIQRCLSDNCDIKILKDYFLNFDYHKNVLDQTTVQNLLMILAINNLNILHNFILQIYSDIYDLSTFQQLNIFKYDPPDNLENLVSCYSKDFSGGIGDFFKGSTYLYEKLKNTNIKFSIDFSKHPLGKFIKGNCDIDYDDDKIVDIEKECNANNDGSPWSIRLNKIIANTINNTKDTSLYISSFFSEAFLVPNYQKNATLYLDHYTISESCSSFFRNNIKFHECVEDLFKSISIDDYEVLHFRLGDRKILSNLNEEIKNFPSNIQQSKNYKAFDHDYNYYYMVALQHLKNSKRKNLIIMSDCNDFKSYITKINHHKNIHILHTQSCHTSYNPSTLYLAGFKNIDIDYNKLMYTSLDTKILSQSKANTSYSVYDWGSGFVYWISKIFNVPCRINTL